MTLAEVIDDHFLAKYRGLLDAEDAAFDEQGQSAIDGRARNTPLDLASHEKEILGGVMLRGVEGRANNRVALNGPPHPFVREKIVNALADSFVHERG